MGLPNNPNKKAETHLRLGFIEKLAATDSPNPQDPRQKTGGRI
jgi:hypothetical protein